MGIINCLKSSLLKKQINQLDPEGLGVKAADFIDKLCDDSLRGQSENAQLTIANFASKFVMAFNKQLLKDRK